MTGYGGVASFGRALLVGVAAALLSGAFLLARPATAECIGDGCVAVTCPAAARLTVSILNRRGADVTATITGSRTRPTCLPAASAKASYAASVVVPGACTGHPRRCACGIGRCSCDALGPRCELTIADLSPGEWRHGISVPPLPPPAPQNTQHQWRTGLLMGASGAASTMSWTAYRTVLTVTSERDDGGAGTLRAQVDAANAAARQAPVLIQFDRDGVLRAEIRQEPRAPDADQ